MHSSMRVCELSVFTSRVVEIADDLRTIALGVSVAARASGSS
jgi:hypothetical protein